MSILQRTLRLAAFLAVPMALGACDEDTGEDEAAAGGASTAEAPASQ